MAERSTRADYFPLAINASGMMSLILAGILWFQALPAAATVCGLHALNNAILNLQINVGIKGAVPGKDTEQLISKQLLRCKLWGGVALASLAVSAHVFDMVCITVLGTPLSATSLLIVVGTVTQASRQP
ncbi:protein translocase subunit SecY [Haematococcus lacustris]|uniref:Protein translocase subunit SecY n=1 Tax=Haematococcus lacustris TaxID=44745 RepID=A0A699YBL5_HAELA|nr:protein translocase subunit SecY [Haematococcus lacustris]